MTNSKPVWDDRLADAVKHTNLKPAKVLAAYNTVTDYVENVTAEKLEKILANEPNHAGLLKEAHAEPHGEISTQRQLLAAILHAISTGKGKLVVSKNPLVFAWTHAAFAGPDSRRMGGQAGVIANQLAALDASSICYTPALSKAQASLFDAKVKAPVVKNKKLALAPIADTANPDARTKINWIFEFKYGLKISINGQVLTAPRTNRVILSSETNVEPGFSAELRPHLGELGKELSAAIFSGYHRLEQVAEKDAKHVKTLLAQERADLRTLKSKNANLLTHYEYVNIPNAALEKEIFNAIIDQFDSFGCNEVETLNLLKKFGFKKEAAALEKLENAANLYHGGYELFKKFKLKRLQIHNLGYYVVFLAKPYRVEPEKVISACLYSSQVANARAELNRAVTRADVLEALKHKEGVSDAGLNQVHQFAAHAIYELKLAKSDFNATHFLTTGIMERKDHYCLIVPTQISSKPHLTVGLGDVVSSTALAAELV